LETNEKHVPVLDFLSETTDTSSQWLSEASENLNALIRMRFDELEHTQAELCDYMADLQSQNRELKAYTSTVAHDLKVPLNVIILTSHLITDKPDLTHAELKNYLQEIFATVCKMDKIIDSLLLFAKVSDTEAPLECVDMSGVLENVLERLSYHIKEHDVQIDIPASWPVAIGYGPWIEEVWANYFSNAIKYGGTPPRVELGASLQPDGTVRYWIRDNGPGIPMREQARLFTAYSQVNPARNSSNGLGLSIARRIVEKMGGQTGCESELGQGSLFFFTLRADPSSC
jgi:two-component system, sensor histidine kinase and response regulator